MTNTAEHQAADSTRSPALIDTPFGIIFAGLMMGLIIARILDGAE